MVKLLSHSEIFSFDSNEVESVKHLKQILSKYNDDLDFYKFEVSKDTDKKFIIVLTIANESNQFLDF